jgi:hypothetical protein
MFGRPPCPHSFFDRVRGRPSAGLEPRTDYPTAVEAVKKILPGTTQRMIGSSAYRRASGRMRWSTRAADTDRL